MSEPLGIIGLGRVGLTAARAYINAGYEVFGYDTNPSVLTTLASAGGKALKSPAEVSRKAGVILIMVLNGDQVMEVTSGTDGLLRETLHGSTVVCMSTINRETLQAVARRCAERNIDFVDCPFTGGPARIASRSLTLIAAAPQAVLTRVRPILEVLGKIVYAGAEPGTAQAIKHCNQLLVGATHAATMEVIVMARRLGLDPSLVASVVASGIAGSDYFRLLSESVLKKTPSPGGLGQMCKDMVIVENTLRAADMHGYVASAAAAYFSAAERMGMRDREGADLIEVVEKVTGERANETGDI